MVRSFGPGALFCAFEDFYGSNKIFELSRTIRLGEFNA